MGKKETQPAPSRPKDPVRKGTNPPPPPDIVKPPPPPPPPRPKK